MAVDTGLSARLKHAQEFREGPIVRSIEEEATARTPSDKFLWAALGVVGLSLALFNSGRKADAMFVGQMATSVLALGLYRRMVQGADDEEP